jgi:hypothetical protein
MRYKTIERHKRKSMYDLGKNSFSPYVYHVSFYIHYGIGLKKGEPKLLLNIGAQTYIVTDRNIWSLVAIFKFDQV